MPKLIARIAVAFLSLLILTLTFILPLRSIRAHAQTTGSSSNTSSQIAQLQQEIAQLQTLIDATKQQKQTLQTAIRGLNLNIEKIQKSVALTQAQINNTNQEIGVLSGNISTTNGKITSEQQSVSSTLQQLNEMDAESLAVMLLSGTSLSSFFTQESNLATVRDGLDSQIQDLGILKGHLQTTRSADEQTKQQLTTLHQTLASQEENLAAARNAKSQLLAETNNKESNYEKLLAQAQAELASFSAFTQNAGGSKLLANQTSCDSWGCYYNQRDVGWGNDPLNGTQYRLASDGCLITSMAMVFTHYGYRDVTPVTINSNSNNFATYFPAYLLYTIYADGVSATREVSSIDRTLAQGDPVIVGLHAYGGTHFVVLTQGSHGDYIMRDPYVANGKDIPFSSHYSMGEIYYAAKVIIS